MNIVIIGGGAAGFFAAIRAAETNPEATVTILERGGEVLGKVRISGGGRCNVTHACWDPRELSRHYPRGGRELLGPFHYFACGDTVDWFARRGVELKIEADGRMFPITDRSQTIIDCLTDEAERLGVQVIRGQRVEMLTPPAGKTAPWAVRTKKTTYTADRLLIATGSNPAIWSLLAELGHTIVPPVPSLFTFNIQDDRIEGLPGVSVDAAALSIAGTKLAAAGPLLITHWGMSGPAILKLSAWGARLLNERGYEFELIVNWLNRHPEDVQQEIENTKTTENSGQITGRSPFALPQRLWRRLVAAAGILPETRWSELSRKGRHRLVEELTAGRFPVRGKSTFKEEFVTAGGVDLREIDFKTFASKRLPNLFLAGEVLDIDAVTGGFNFQAAWTGGWIAGGAMTKPGAGPH